MPVINPNKNNYCDDSNLIRLAASFPVGCRFVRTTYPEQVGTIVDDLQRNYIVKRYKSAFLHRKGDYFIQVQFDNPSHSRGPDDKTGLRSSNIRILSYP